MSAVALTVSLVLFRLPRVVVDMLLSPPAPIFSLCSPVLMPLILTAAFKRRYVKGGKHIRAVEAAAETKCCSEASELDCSVLKLSAVELSQRIRGGSLSSVVRFCLPNRMIRFVVKNGCRLPFGLSYCLVVCPRVFLDVLSMYFF